MSLKYRPEIDGLRAIAVLAVVFFHLQLLGVTGGYIGVDIFFVISGYLITGIILQESEQGSFSIVNFYKRRIRRILPLAIVVSLFAFSGAYILYDNITFLSNTHILKHSLLFISNFLLVQKRGYFEPSVEDHLFLHSWSLSIEEQFYIVFPLCFVLLYRYSRKRYKIWWAIVAVISFAFNLFIAVKNPRADFYWPYTRIWELLAGGLLAMGLFSPIKSDSRKQWYSLSAIVVLIVLFFAYNSNLTYPGFYGLIPVLAAVLLIHSSSSPGTYVHCMLTAKPLVFTGKISYSIYMWHFPMFIIINFLSIEPLSVAAKFLLILVIYGISCLSYFFIEQPFRRNTAFMKTKGPVILLCALVVTYSVIKFSTSNNNGICGRDYSKYKQAEIQKETFLKSCELDGELDTEDSIMHMYKMGDKYSTPAVLIYGDSHATVLAFGMDSMAKEKHQAFYTITNPGYPPLNRVYKKSDKLFSLEANRDVLRFINEHKELKTIVLSARWLTYYNETYIDKLVVEGKKGTKQYDKEQVFEYGLNSTIDSIINMGRTVVITTPIPEIKCEPGKMLIIKKLFGYTYNDFSRTPDEYLQLNHKLLIYFERLRYEKHVTIVDVSRGLLQNGYYTITLGDNVYYSDNNHLSLKGARLAAAPLAPLFYQ